AVGAALDAQPQAAAMPAVAVVVLVWQPGWAVVAPRARVPVRAVAAVCRRSAVPVESPVYRVTAAADHWLPAAAILALGRHWVVSRLVRRARAAAVGHWRRAASVQAALAQVAALALRVAELQQAAMPVLSLVGLVVSDVPMARPVPAPATSAPGSRVS